MDTPPRFREPVHADSRAEQTGVSIPGGLRAPASSEGHADPSAQSSQFREFGGSLVRERTAALRGGAYACNRALPAPSVRTSDRDNFRDNQSEIVSRVTCTAGVYLGKPAAVRWPRGRRRRVAKRRSAFRLSPFFLANPRVSITSSIERLGGCWLLRPGFGSWQGQFQGQSRIVTHNVQVAQAKPVGASLRAQSSCWRPE